MVICESEVRHRTDRNVVIAFRRGEDLGTFFDGPDAKDRDLRLVNDGSSEQAAEDAGICDRKRSTGDFVRVEFLRPGSIGKIVRRQCEAGQ